MYAIYGLLFFLSKGLLACKRLDCFQVLSMRSIYPRVDRHAYGWPSGGWEGGKTESKRQDILRGCNGREEYGQREDNEEQSKPVHVHFWRCGIGPEPCILYVSWSLVSFESHEIGTHFVLVQGRTRYATITADHEYRAYALCAYLSYKRRLMDNICYPPKRVMTNYQH